jgi:hypothetical protein
MREFPLPSGDVVLVDDDDFAAVTALRWHVHRSRRSIYAVHERRPNGKKTRIFLHHFLVGRRAGKVVDHINGNGLDNRRSNLRICDPIDNSRNRRPNKGTKFKGVSKVAGASTFSARIQGKNYQIHLGCFRTQVEAALAYDAAAKRLRGEFSCLNFHSGADQ